MPASLGDASVHWLGLPHQGLTRSTQSFPGEACSQETVVLREANPGASKCQPHQAEPLDSFWACRQEAPEELHSPGDASRPSPGVAAAPGECPCRVLQRGRVQGGATGKPAHHMPRLIDTAPLTLCPGCVLCAEQPAALPAGCIYCEVHTGAERPLG